MFGRLLRTSPRNSFFVFGARGTGKTTYIKQKFCSERSLYVDLLDPVVEDTYRRTPHRLEQEILALPIGVDWVLVDEVQRAPRLLDVAHRLIEATPKRFVLTGSSAKTLRRGASNLLAGRAFIYNLYPLTVPELGDALTLDDALHWGTLPQIYSLSHPQDKQEYLRAYALTYLKEEIVVEQLVRRLDPFRHFLEVAAQSTGLVLNYTNIARDVGVDPKTVISYYSILEDTLVGFLLPAYHRSIRKKQLANPKFYFFDIGVKRALDRTLQLPLNAGTFEYGRLFEQFIVTQISHLSRYRYPDWRLSHLRTSSGVEVDLLIERPGLPVVLIKVKSTLSVDDRDVRTVASLVKDFENPLALCISRDQSRKRIKNVLCVHWRDALEELDLD